MTCAMYPARPVRMTLAGIVTITVSPTFGLDFFIRPFYRSPSGEGKQPWRGCVISYAAISDTYLKRDSPVEAEVKAEAPSRFSAVESVGMLLSIPFQTVLRQS